MPFPTPTVTERQDYSEGWSYIPQDSSVNPATGQLSSGEYRLSSVVGKYVLSVSGLGLPPIEYPVQRGPFQQGETPLDYFLQPRVLQLGIRQRTPDRAHYWGNAIPNTPSAVSAPPYGQGRGGLLNALRPNKLIDPTTSIPTWGPARLRFYRSPLPSRPFTGSSTIDLSGTKAQPEMMDINVLVTEALSDVQPVPNVWDSHGFSDIIRFTAHDPLFYYPVRQSVTATRGAGAGTDWGPITIEIPYFGTWADYPVIVFDSADASPLNLGSVILEMQRHGITRQTVNLTATTGTAGETSITFDFEYGFKLIYSSPNNVNLIPYLSAASDMATFRLEPYPIAATGGINVLRLTATGVNTQTRVTVYYYNRYIGI